MSFKDSFVDKVNTAGKVILPIILTLIGIVVGIFLLGAIGSWLWICIVWCIQKIWKVLLIVLVILIIYYFFTH